MPPLTDRVVDFAQMFSDAQRQELTQQLAAFEAQKGSQIVLLTVPSTEPETIEQYGIRVGETWKIGRGKIDDGAVLIIAKNDRAVRIEVGYGLEGALNDATSKRIIEEVIIPQFKLGDFFAGARDGLAAMINVVNGEELPPPERQAAKGDTVGNLFTLLVIGLTFGSFFAQLLGPRVAPGFLGTLWGLFAFLVTASVLGSLFFGLISAVFFFFAAQSKFHTGRYSGTSGFGGGGFGGFSSGGGGFSGGGGSFGGGGASGRW